ncbi:MAG: N-6 DNA methylase [Planctomycetaceae bacterium]|nr:N-6 DNA methylase [Planctomycetaceae bacterium]
MRNFAAKFTCNKSPLLSSCPFKSVRRKEFGDFQTPWELSKLMIEIIKEKNIRPKIIIEPTCGIGNILLSSYNAFLPDAIIGVEINNNYCQHLSKIIEKSSKITIINKNIFDTINIIKTEINKYHSCLFIGNPPWVTNSALSAINSTNLPVKENRKGLRGIEAITGKSNFDITEYIILKLIEEYRSYNSVYAFLCKTSVARNILKYCWENNFFYKESSIYPIDSKKYFDATVDACFFIIDFSKKGTIKECHVYDSIENKSFSNTMGYFNNKMIVDINNFNSHNYLGKSEYIWRNGIKHDCSKVMELDMVGKNLVNGYGEIVNIEDDLVFPLLKSSDIANGNLSIRKKVIVTQRNVGEETLSIKERFPKTWKYLNYYIDNFQKRKSSIYRNKPLFSIFSIGGYSFLPIKIAISGLYKHISFQMLFPENEKSIMVDDTCNYISCKTKSEANLIYSLLTSKENINFLNSIIFWDSKRPITTEILNSINLKRIAEEHSLENQYDILTNINNTVEKENGKQMVLF